MIRKQPRNKKKLSITKLSAFEAQTKREQSDTERALDGRGTDDKDGRSDTKGTSVKEQNIIKRHLHLEAWAEEERSDTERTLD